MNSTKTDTYLNIPEELLIKPQWALHDESKRPWLLTGSGASSTTPEQWHAFSEVTERVRKEPSFGVSFALNNDYIGIDLDNCYTGNTLKKWAKDIVTNLPNAYIEKSISGKGLHIFLRKKRMLKHKDKTCINLKLGAYKTTLGSLDEDIQELIKEDKKNIPKDAIEVYYKARFLTMTGEAVQKPEKIGEHQDYIEFLYASLVDISLEDKVNASSSNTGASNTGAYKLVKDSVSIMDILKFYKNDSLENGFANCPFHSENIKSLHIYPTTNSFYCFGCQAGGDIIKYVALTENIKNSEAVKFIAEKFNISLESAKPPSKILEEDGKYYSFQGEVLYQVSNFTLKTNYYIELAEYSLSVDIMVGSKSYRDVILSLSDFENKNRFKTALHKLTNGRASYYGTDVQVEHIKDLCMTEVETIRGLTYAGVHKDGDRYFYVNSDSEILSNEELDQRYTLVTNRKQIETDILNAEYVDISQYVKVVKDILSYNSKGTMLTLLGYMSACFFKSRLKEAKIKFPHFNLVAESGTGKTVMKDTIILPFFSLLTEESVASTRFPINCCLASNNSIPLVIDEFKMGKMTKQELKIWSEINRLAFEVQVYSRGRKDMSSDEYRYISPLIFIGEGSYTDLADKNRCIDVYTQRYTSPEDIRKLTDIQNDLLTNENVINALGNGILKTSLSYDVAELKELYTYSRSQLTKLQPRNKDSVSVIWCGIELLKRFFDDIGYDLTELFGSDEEVLSILENIQFDVNQGGKNLSMSVVPKILETFDTMLDMDILNSCHITKAKGDIAFNVKRIYPLFTKFIKEYGIEMEMLTVTQFTQQLRHSQYFEKYSPAYFSKSTEFLKDNKKVQQRAYIVSAEKLKKDDICLNILTIE